jgi:predicted dehydrogenase
MAAARPQFVEAGKTALPLAYFVFAGMRGAMAASFEPVRIAIVGCGAIAELGHLPGAAACDAVEVAVLVDRDGDRARDLARRFGVRHAATDIAAAAEHAEAAVIALPPHLHRQAAEDLFARGLHVLMEKPLAPDPADAGAIVAAAGAAGRVLATAMMRRFAPSARYLKAAVESGMLGPIRRYAAASGAADAWPSRSAFTFDAAQAGGGALISNGCHDLDLLFWLLGPFSEFTYASDSAARMEANCVVEGVLACGAEASIEVSRSRTLANRITIEGEHATLIAPLMGETVRVLPAGTEASAFPWPDEPPFDYPATMAAQLADFASAVRGGKAPLADGEAGQAMIDFVAQCYQRRTALTLPWDVPIALEPAA